MRRKIFLLCVSLCTGLLFGSRPVQAVEKKDVIIEDAETQEGMKQHFYGNTVRVGWFDCEGYFEKDKDGNLMGFGVDYLNAIAVYTGWEYEFVKSTREGCLEMLQS